MLCCEILKDNRVLWSFDEKAIWNHFSSLGKKKSVTPTRSSPILEAILSTYTEQSLTEKGL